MAAEHGGRRIKAVDKTFDILRCIAERGDTTVSEIADAVDLAPGTVHTHLTTLKRRGFVQQEGDRYLLGMEFIPFSERVRNQTSLYRAGKDEVDKLAHKHDAVAHLATEYNGKLLILHETFGEEAVGKQIHVEKRDEPQTHMHCTAAGKAIMAHMPEEEVAAIIDEEGLPSYTSHTITDEETLYDELERIREQRYAVNNEEVVHGNKGIGAPVIHDDGDVAGAISISGPANNWRSSAIEEELIEAVIRSANNAEIEIYTGADL
ncbi:IclR family transcriptional regulator [Halobellus rubicundus]|uniref:IclR family transcriptional regulator n=1 Tax=Halobellus rubicundus TaxID=2996466 RepID=A0ABD5MGC3_9EURY